MPERKRYRHIMRAVHNEPWAMEREKLHQVATILEARERGESLSEADIIADIGDERIAQHAEAVQVASDDRKPFAYHPGSGIAVLSVLGLISKRMDMMTWISGGTSTDRLARQLRAALADDDVSAILLDVDSPGGTLQGTMEIAAEIYAARGRKPIYASANTAAHSGGYWIAAAADKFYASPSASVGSVGVYMIHVDTQGVDQKAGIKRIVFRAGEYKAEGLAEDLSESAQEHRQAIVDRAYGHFVGAVSTYRGVSADTVVGTFGKGRSYPAEVALDRRMIDGVETIEATFDRLAAAVAASDKGSSIFGQRVEGANAMKVTNAIFAAMVAAGLCVDSTDRSAAESVLTGFLAGKGQPKASEDDILSMLGAVKPVQVQEPATPPGTPGATGTPGSVTPPATPGATRTQATPATSADDIMAAVRLAHLPADCDRLALVQQLVGENLSLRETLNRLQTMESTASPPPTGGRVAVTVEARDKMHVAAVDQLVARHFGTMPERVWDYRARDYRTPTRVDDNFELRSLLGLGKRCLIMSGVPAEKAYGLSNHDVAQLVMGANPRDFGLMVASDGASFNVSGMFSDILFDAQNVGLRRSFDDSRTTYQIWMRRDEDITDFKPVHAVLAGQTGDPKAIPEDGEFSEDTMTDTRETYKLTVWGKVWSQSWQSVVNDRLRAFMEVPAKQGAAMQRKLNRLAYGQLLDNPTMAEDSTALFHADHGNLTTGASKKPNDTPEISIMTKKMMEQSGLGADSAALNLMPRWMLVPPNTRTEALELRRSTSPPTAGGSNPGTSGRANVFENTFDVVVEAELGANSSNSNGSDNAFYLATDAMQCEHLVYAFLQGLTTPRLEREMSFTTLGQKQRCYIAFATKAVEWRGLQKHTGEA